MPDRRLGSPHQVVYFANHLSDPVSAIAWTYRHLSSSQGIDAIQALESLPDKIRQVLAEAEAIRELAVKYGIRPGFLFFGTSVQLSIALEGALQAEGD